LTYFGRPLGKLYALGGNSNHRKVEVVWYLYSEEQNGKSYEETELKAKERFCSSR